MIIPVIRLSRPYYSLPLSLGLIVIASYIAGNEAFDSKFILASLSLYLVISAGYILNDVCDIKADTVNAPDRPLITKSISIRAATVASCLFFTCGLALSAICGLHFMIVLTLTATVLVIYDVYSKRLGVIKNILAAVLTTSLYPLAFAITEPLYTSRLQSLYIFPVWLFLTSLGYEMLKDIRDSGGDFLIASRMSRQYITNPLFLLSARTIIIIAALLTILPFVLGCCGIIYLICSCSALLLAASVLFKSPVRAIPFVYAEVFIVAAGAMVDLLVYGS